MINYIDKMADALVDVLKYSDSTVEWVEVDGLKKDDGVLVDWFYPAIENYPYSEVTAILQYTQQEAVYEEIGEQLLGIALVEMKHYAVIRDMIVRLGGTLPRPYNNKNVEIGGNVIEALMLGVKAELNTIDFYQSVKAKFTTETKSVKIARRILDKLIADEILHLRILNEKLIEMLGDEYEAKIVDISKIKAYLNH